MKQALVILILVAIVGTSAVASRVVDYPSGTPLSLRFAILEWIPGYERVVAWDARRTASADFGSGKSVLLGTGLNGTKIAVEGCWVAQYDSVPSIESPLPWLPSLSGPAVVHCNSESTRHATAVTMVEVGRVAFMLRVVFARAYNETTLALTGAHDGANV